MSITSATRPATATWLPVLVWSQVTLASAGVVAALVSPLPGIAVGVALAAAGLGARALRRASLTLDRIFDEELDR